MIRQKQYLTISIVEKYFNCVGLCYKDFKERKNPTNYRLNKCKCVIKSQKCTNYIYVRNNFLLESKIYFKFMIKTICVCISMHVLRWCFITTSDR